MEIQKAVIIINILELTVEKFHNALKNGEITTELLVKKYLERIEAYDKKGPKLNSIIMINPNVIQEAKELDKQFAKKGLIGPLHGVPILLKDNVDTNDMPTTGGSKSLEGYIPNKNAFIVDQMKAAGAIIIAKVNLHEFAIWGETISSILGQTLNPYDLTRTPGGSSGGTGASIAANFGLIGIGTDTINSVRSPASANSLVGIRPTVGLVSKGGVIPYSYTQDACGPIARTVEDATRLLDVISGYDSNDKKTAWSIGRKSESYINNLKIDGLKGKKIGVLNSLFGENDIHLETNNVVEKAITIMKDNGADIIQVNDEIDTDYLVKNVSVHLYDLQDHLNSYLEKLPEDVAVHSLQDILETGLHHEGIKDNLINASKLATGTDMYNKRLIERAKMQDKIINLMAHYDLDALVYPHQKQLVCKVGGSQNERNGVLGSVIGFPSICVPAGYSNSSEDAPIGVPVGMEILGRPFSESVIIEIAYSYEKASKIRQTPPCVSSLD